MNISGYPWNSMEFHRFPMISIDFHGCPWIFMDFPTDFHGFPRILMDSNRFQMGRARSYIYDRGAGAGHKFMTEGAAPVINL